jgi:lysyl-tRNA synthetase class 2
VTTGAATRGWVRGAPATFAYLFVLLVTTLVVDGVDPPEAHRLLLQQSTNLDRLGHDPVYVLFASAFWLERSWMLVAWFVAFTVVVAPLERRLGSGRVVATFAAGHVGGSLLAATAIWAAIRADVFERKVAYVQDVGASYGFLALAAVFVYLLRGRVRLLAAGLLFGGVAASFAVDREYEGFGHLVAIAIGFGCASLVTRPLGPVGRAVPAALHGARRRLSPLARLELHKQGPRCHLLGCRIHEWQLGAGLLAAAGAGWAVGRSGPRSLWFDVALAAGAWMVAKDWRDLLRSTRDGAVWQLGPHRRPLPLRAVRHAEGLPLLAAAVVFALGVVNLVSALAPNLAWRHHVLLAIEPVEAVPVLHTLALPASVGLLIAAFFLRRRRRRALYCAIALLVVLGWLDLFKGLDIEEALLSWAAAAALWAGRAPFYVGHERLSTHSRIWAGLVTALVGVAVGCYVAFLVVGEPAPTAARQTFDVLTWRTVPSGFHDELSLLSLLVAGVTLLAAVVGAILFFRPLQASSSFANTAERAQAAELVRAHGGDTLAFFKLRRDLHYLFGRHGNAFLGYRVDRGVMLIAGDPVGPAAELPGLVRDACAFAELRGLRVGALGAGAGLLAIYRQAGLRSLYIGDEAIIETGSFSLEGRLIRKVRQSVGRLERGGFTATLIRFSDLDETLLRQLEDVSALWRRGEPERGFSMALDSLRGEHHRDSIIVASRDRDDRIRGFLHFVPSYGRPAVSLSYMRRDRQTPNGLTEFLVVRAIELLREQGIAEISLNFAAFGRFLDRPSNRVERVVGRLVTLGNPFFQIESLYRFNAKFSPRWEPRYLVYEGAFGLPAAGLAALRVEGQTPRLRSRTNDVGRGQRVNV